MGVSRKFILRNLTDGTMNIITRVVFASALTFAISAPAFAAYFEQPQLPDQAYNQATDTAPRAYNAMRSHAMGQKVRGHRAIDSMASEPAQPQIDPDYRYFHDFGIGSQS
jgi:hypothetical protein